MIKERPSNAAFYVYAIVVDGTIVYVGKGSGNRVHQHAANARAGRVSPLYDRLRLAWRLGQETRFMVLHETANEREAFSVEAHYIERFKSPSLCNKISGHERKVKIPYTDADGGDGFYVKSFDDMNAFEHQLIADRLSVKIQSLQRRMWQHAAVARNWSQK